MFLISLEIAEQRCCFQGQGLPRISQIILQAGKEEEGKHHHRWQNSSPHSWGVQDLPENPALLKHFALQSRSCCHLTMAIHKVFPALRLNLDSSTYEAPLKDKQSPFRWRGPVGNGPRIREAPAQHGTGMGTSACKLDNFYYWWHMGKFKTNGMQPPLVNPSPSKQSIHKPLSGALSFLCVVGTSRREDTRGCKCVGAEDPARPCRGDVVFSPAC